MSHHDPILTKSRREVAQQGSQTLRSRDRLCGTGTSGRQPVCFHVVPMMQVYGEGLQRAPRPAAKNERNKRRRVALGDRTNANELDAAPPKKVAKKLLKKTKRSTGGTQVATNLPEGWITDVSRTSGETYYRNTVTDDAQWEVPTEPAVPINHTPAIEHVHQTLQHLGATGIRVIECAQLPQPLSPVCSFY